MFPKLNKNNANLMSVKIWHNKILKDDDRENPSKKLPIPPKHLSSADISFGSRHTYIVCMLRAKGDNVCMSRAKGDDST